MNAENTKTVKRGESRKRLLEAAISIIRKQGFNSTSVDDLCDFAEVSKGAFFHHFKSKEMLGVEAVKFWIDMTSALFANASYHDCEDPLDRVLAYVEFRKNIIQGDIEEFTCLAGTMTQEVYLSSPEIRSYCKKSLFDHADTLVPDIEAAMQSRDKVFNFSAASLARHTQAVIQGAFILAKASNDAAMATENINHLKQYIELQFK